MQYFGSKRYGRADFGSMFTSAVVDESQSTSSTDVAGYLLFDTCGIHTTSITDLNVVGGIQRLAHLHIKPISTVIASGILMELSPRLDLGSGTSTMQSSGYIAWDGQTVPDTTWTTQTIE